LYFVLRPKPFQEKCPGEARALGALAAHAGHHEGEIEPMARKPFKGTIKLDIRDSKADWTPYLPAKAPAGSPNILFVLYDDTGLAAWSPLGGLINRPTLQKLANQDLRYSQWHTTALCSPTSQSPTQEDSHDP
jgi:Sulfatase